MKKIFKNISLIGIIALLFSACYQYPTDSELEYRRYNRVVGPQGGEIVFLSNYANDADTSMVVKMQFPAGAVDSSFVFNMYEFENIDLVQKLKTDGLAIAGSKFLYFVPFYESQGYNENGQLDLSYHLSLKFKEPVSVTYTFLNENQEQSNQWEQNQLYYDFYKKATKLYQLYKIKIPRIDEWSKQNIYIAWNNQGYPVGYNGSQLEKIISGEMSAAHPDGTGNSSLQNWQLVDTFNIDGLKNEIKFTIFDTDYLYVLAQKIEIDPTKIPRPILTAVKQIFPDATIERASMDLTDKVIRLYLSNGFTFVFSRRDGFAHVEKSELDVSEIPSEITTLVASNYPTQTIRSVSYNSGIWNVYSVLLSSGEKLYFNDAKTLVGNYQYGIDPSQLAQPILDVIAQKFPNQAITNVTYDAENSVEQGIVYLSNDVKLVFNSADFSLQSEIHFHLTENDIPEPVFQFIEENEPGVQISAIQYYINPSSEGKHFTVDLINGTLMDFKTDYTIQYYATYFFDETKLPQAIKDSLAKYQKTEITQISYIYNDNPNTGLYVAYDVQLSGGLNVYFEGEAVAFIEGSNLNQIPQPNADFILSLLPNAQVLVFYYYSADATDPAMFDFYLKNDLNIGIGLNNEILYYETSRFVIENLPQPMLDIVNTEVPGDNMVDFWYDETDAVNTWNTDFFGDQHLVVDANFNFVSLTDYDVLDTDILPAMLTYIQTNYAFSFIDSYVKKFSATYTKMVYEVSLDTGQTLVFGISGNLLGSFRSLHKNKRVVKPKNAHHKKQEFIKKAFRNKKFKNLK